MARRQIFTDDSAFDSTFFFKRSDKPSATNRNRKGDRGSPCRRPPVGANESRIVPLNLTSISPMCDTIKYEFVTLLWENVKHMSFLEVKVAEKRLNTSLLPSFGET